MFLIYYYIFVISCARIIMRNEEMGKLHHDVFIN